jgi:hypothetical protein
MGKINCFIICLIISLNCFGQKNEDSLFFAKMPAKYINILQEVSPQKQSIPFTDVDVIDDRFDTSCVGFAYNAIKHSHEKVSLQTSANAQVKNFILKNYITVDTSKNSWKLLVIIQKMWITNVAIIDSEKSASSDKSYITQSNLFISAKLMAEKNDSFCALYSIDSVLVFYKQKADKDFYFIQQGIDLLLNNIANKQISEIKMHKRYFTKNEIVDYFFQQRQISILTDTIYKKGVFKTFEEFKQNLPSITDFEVSYSDKTDELYVKDEKGTNYLLKDFWGFSDGRKLFVNQANNFFELCKNESTFYVNGFKSLTKGKYEKFLNYVKNYYLLDIIGNPLGSVKYEGFKIPLQLDMETGELF